MKVLIIESNINTLDNAIRTVRRHFKSAKIVHVNNYNDAIKTNIDEFDLIIMNMFFCRAKPYENTDPILHTQTGSMFLAHLARKKACTPVIIYSSTKDYMEIYKSFLFPSFELICYNFDSYPLFIEGSEVEKLYNESTANGEKLLQASNFVIDHAHTLAELERSLYKFRHLMKKAG